jgi:DNA repair protein RadC
METIQVSQQKHCSIRKWADEEKPRERLLTKGAESLSNAELLAILIGSGTRSRSAVDLAREALSMAQNNLHELGQVNIKQLQQIKGIGEARAIMIAATLELGRRRQISEGLSRSVISGSGDAATIVVPLLRDLKYEMFYALYLNTTNKLIHHEKISTGGMTETVADIRIILKTALFYNTNQIIVAHNHPSGSLQPSSADKALTQKLKDAASTMDIKLLDHLIVANANYLSMADKGFM